MFAVCADSHRTGENISLDWVAGIGGASGSQGNAIAVDAAGYVYVGGSFSGMADFDPGPGILSLNTNGGSDIFIAKYDASGKYIWARKIGGTGSDAVKKLITDTSGHIYLTGTFAGTVNFDPAGGGSASLTSNGGDDIFVAKFDTAGNYIWAKNAGGTGSELVNGMGIDRSGGVYITGGFMNTMYFGAAGSSTGVPAITSNGGQDAYFARYDAAGNYVWGRNIGAANTEEGLCIRADDSGNVYIAGRFQETVDFNPGSGVANLISNSGGLDIYVAKYSPAGEYIWAFAVGGATGSDLPKDLVFEQATGHIWVVGQFAGTADFDPGTPTVNLESTGTAIAGFIARYDRNGNYLLARSIGGATGTFLGVSTIALNAASNIYITGYFAGQVDFDPGTPVVNHTSTGLFQDAFFAKYDAGLNYVWSAPVQGTGTYSFTDGTGVTTAGDGNIYYTGTYAGKIGLGTRPEDSLSSGGGFLSNTYMVKFTDKCPSFGSLTVAACDGYSFNGHTYTATGTYTETFAGAHCDSIVTLNLTIHPSPTATVIKNDSVLTANNAGSYQWINCADNTVIPGAGSQNYTVTASGSYAVIITDNGCSDTSDCVTVALGIQGSASGNTARLYPNPTDGRISIQTGQPLNHATIRVMNTVGQVLQEHTNQQGSLFRISMEGYRAGMYFVEIADNASRIRMSVVKD